MRPRVLVVPRLHRDRYPVCIPQSVLPNTLRPEHRVRFARNAQVLDAPIIQRCGLGLAKGDCAEEMRQVLGQGVLFSTWGGEVGAAGVHQDRPIYAAVSVGVRKSRVRRVRLPVLAGAVNPTRAGDREGVAVAAVRQKVQRDHLDPSLRVADHDATLDGHAR